jgi:RHS repeat-associated protein
VAGGPTTTSVSYVNKFFEVREHDAPVKYVWNANTRVARVSSSLLTNARVQRLRLSPGWNLCSLAVSAEAALQQMHDSQPPLLDAQSARRWNSATLSWIPVSEQESLAAGTVLWIHARTNATVSLTGTYAAPGEGILSATTGFWPNAGFESWDLAALPAALQTGSAWVYDASDARWSSLLPANLAPPGNLPSSLGPGQAVFFASSVPVQIQMPPTSSRICYFHQDHVGSTAVVTDAQGNVVQETALFPFGVLRHEGDQTRRRLPYQFAQKERDAESSLDYFESRFLNASFGRFLSADPALGSVTSQTLSNPQLQHAYAYGANNPLRFLDADGRKPSPVKAKSGIKIGGGSVSLDREGNVGISVGKAQVEINSKKQISKVKLGPVEVDQKGAKVQVGVASVGFSNEGKKLEYTATAGATFEAGLGEQAKVEATAEVEAGLAIEPSGREDEAYKALYGGVDRPEKFTLFARAKAKFKALFNMGGTEHEVEAEETAETESSYNPLQGVQNNYMRALNASKSD